MNYRINRMNLKVMLSSFLGRTMSCYKTLVSSWANNSVAIRKGRANRPNTTQKRSRKHSSPNWNSTLNCWAWMRHCQYLPGKLWCLHSSYEVPRLPSLILFYLNNNFVVITTRSNSLIFILIIYLATRQRINLYLANN